MKRSGIIFLAVLSFSVVAYAAVESFPDGIVIGKNEEGKPPRYEITGFYNYVTPSSVAYPQIQSGLHTYEFTLTDVDYAHVGDTLDVMPLNALPGQLAFTGIVSAEGVVKIRYMVDNPGAAYTPIDEDQWLVNIWKTSLNEY